MNPAEEIVKYWLQENNYFFQSSIKVPKSRGKEIDILAIDNEEKERKHIEVSVSIRMADYENNPTSKAEDYYKNKFNHPEVKKEVEARLGAKYTKELIVGDLTLQKKDCLNEFTEQCKKFGIKVTHISTILNEIIPKLGTETHLNSIIKTTQLVSVFYNRKIKKI